MRGRIVRILLAMAISVSFISSGEAYATEVDCKQKNLQPIYTQIADRFHLPVSLLAAIDRYGELNKNETSSVTSMFGLTLNEALWSGPYNPSQPDFDPRTLHLFGGVGVDGNGDGLALPFDDWDRISSIANQLAAGGIVGFANVMQDPNAIVEIAAFETIFEQYGLSPHGYSFPLDKHYPYTMVNSFGEARGFGGTRHHEGEDIFAAVGTPVLSCTYGYVENKGWNRLGGWRLGILDTEGRYFYYAHLSRYAIDLERGDVVYPGKIVGYVGDTGYGKPGTHGKFPPHLHFGVYLQKNRVLKAVNPLPYLSEWERSPQTASSPSHAQEKRHGDLQFGSKSMY